MRDHPPLSPSLPTSRRGHGGVAGVVLVGTLLPVVARAATLEALSETWAGLPVATQDATLFLSGVLGSLLAAKLTRGVWNWVLLPIARRTRTALDVMILEATGRSAQGAVLAAGLYLGAQMGFRHNPRISGHLAWTIYTGLTYVAVVLSVTLVLVAGSRAVAEWYARKLAGQEHPALDQQYVVLGRKVINLVLLFVALTVVFGHFGVQVTGLLATAGVASLAVALAAQETLSNMIAGFALMVDQCFRPGDRVELANGKMGDVLEVGLRSTRLLTFDHTVINIPNADIAKNQIVNLNAPNAKFKIRATLGVAYGTDLRRVKQILREILGGHPEILKEPAPAVYFTAFGESSLDLLYVCWVADYREQFRIRDEVNMAIKDAFETSGVEIPFPQRDVHLRGLGCAAGAERAEHASAGPKGTCPFGGNGSGDATRGS